jgi:hypothetical protein
MLRYYRVDFVTSSKLRERIDMLKITDKQRATYLLEVRSAGRFRLWDFIWFNKRRYIFMSAYIVLGAIYFVRWGTVYGLFGFVGLSVGVLITDLSWLRGRNQSWRFQSAVTNWDEVAKIADGR